MTLLDACTTFCTTLTTTVGPTVANYVCIALVAGLAWWNARKAKATNVVLTAQVAATEKKAIDAHLQLARIEGSLRPAAMVSTSVIPPLIGRPSSASQTNLEPVTMPELHPSTPTPDSAAFPPPPRMPSESVGTTYMSEDEAETKPATPSAKRRL
jgi:hypothetical protein